MERVDQARALMLSFGERGGPSQRYLWTDAFAVCNWVAICRASGHRGCLVRAHELVDRVHRVLGRHRDDDPRTGWISGLSEEEGEQSPTCGGLRIGKKLPERGPRERIDPQLEWDRDGQYFHYLTKWMHALDVLGRHTGDDRPRRWARELAVRAHRGFTYVSPGGAPRMYWKMSIDLTRPLVASMGQHDPLDGFVTCMQIGGLDEQAASFASMLDRMDLETDDPLGVGGLLIDAGRLEQLESHGVRVDRAVHDRVVAAARFGLERISRGRELEQRAERRLAFRELGLSIGLAAVAHLRSDRGRELERYLPMRRVIDAFWLEPRHREVDTWKEHRDISEVMLATSLLPDGVLDLPGHGPLGAAARSG